MTDLTDKQIFETFPQKRSLPMVVSALLLLVVFLGGVLPITAQEQKRTTPSPWEHSVVTVEVARKSYDYYQPWTKRNSRLQKTGVVIGKDQILTTADEMFDRTLVRLQKYGRGRWWMGEVTWIDYHANLALVTTSEAEFWSGLKPVALDKTAAQNDKLQILRWRDGSLENRSAEFSRYEVREAELSQVNY